jgi:hypothetical protein
MLMTSFPCLVMSVHPRTGTLERENSNHPHFWGLNFLGQNVHRYADNLFIKPTNMSIKAFINFQ